MEKDIKGYEGLYTIDDQGRVYSCRAHRYMKPAKCGSGYLKVMLCKDKVYKNAMIHRLVADAFIPNKKGKPTINHIDGDKTNNTVSNLEWNTYSENLKHAYSHGLNYWCKEKGRPMRKVIQLDVYSGERIKTYPCLGDAARSVGAYSQSSIIEACTGKIMTCQGYVWRYEESPFYLEDFKDFIHCFRDSNSNMKGEDVYKAYCNFTRHEFCRMPIRHFYKLLKHYGIMQYTGRIGNKTARNVVRGKELCL